MPLEPSKAGLPIFDTKALPIEPNTPVQWDTEERTAKKGVERTALQRESELPVEWMEVLVIMFSSQSLTIICSVPHSLGWPCGAALHLSCEIPCTGMHATQT